MEPHGVLPRELKNHKVTKQAGFIDQALHHQQEMFFAFEERLDNCGSALHRETGGYMKGSRAARRMEFAPHGQNLDEKKAMMI
eukprot:12398005-Karenia_brevis.AAC.1